jgi:hypothetical protein
MAVNHGKTVDTEQYGSYYRQALGKYEVKNCESDENGDEDSCSRTIFQ